MQQVVYGTKGAVELPTPDVEFRVPPVAEPGDRPAPDTSTRNRRISIIPSRGKGAFQMRRRPVMTYCVINGVGRMSFRIERCEFAKLAVSSNSWECALGLLAQSQALS